MPEVWAKAGGTVKLIDVPVAYTKIVVDTYERDLIFHNLLEMGVAYPEKLPLPFGDYWIRRRDGGLVSVEHKYTDLADNRFPARLRYQLDKAIKGGADEVVLLVEQGLEAVASTGRLLAGHMARKKTWEEVWTTILGWQRSEDVKLRVYLSLRGSLPVARALRSIQASYRRRT